MFKKNKDKLFDFCGNFGMGTVKKMVSVFFFAFGILDPPNFTFASRNGQKRS